VWERISTIGTINWHYRRAVPDAPAQRREALMQEVCCFLYGVGLILLIGRGVITWTLLLQIFALVLFATAINYVRALASHRYLSEGRVSNYLEQLLDSNTVPGHPLLTELWAPLGLRYHALHHVVPSIPYHNLGIAHRRLMASLPADSPYRATIRIGLVDALGAVIRPIRRSADLT
jgi:fatty acid desaturase